MNRFESDLMNPKVPGSNPGPATNEIKGYAKRMTLFFVKSARVADLWLAGVKYPPLDHPIGL
jgi:hypothetical protein